jgi:hypothetical protein
VRELVPRHPLAAVAAGLLVAFQPMFAFMSGAVNNDNGVNAVAAIIVYLTVRALRRGLTPRSGAALAVALVALPVMKSTGYSLYPLVGLALAGLVWRRHARADLHAYAAFAVAAVATYAGWKLIAPLFDYSGPELQSQVSDIAVTSAPGLHNLSGYLSYLWQVFLPPLPFMTDVFVPALPFYDIYVVRGFGAFGWYAVLFPEPVYRVIFVALVAIAVGGAVALWRYSGWARRHWMELAFLVLVPCAVVAAVALAYSTSEPRAVTAEFGRYAFPAMAALAALCVGACFALGRARVAIVATGLVTVTIVFNYAAQILLLAGTYT